MSGSAGSSGEKAATPPSVPPSRPRHHFTRSLSELSSPIARFHRHTQSHSQRDGREGREGREGRHGREGRDVQATSSSSAAASSTSSLSPSARGGAPLTQPPSAATSMTLIPTATATSTRSSLEVPPAEPEPSNQPLHWSHGGSGHTNANSHVTSIAALAAAASAAAAASPTQVSPMAFPAISPMTTSNKSGGGGGGGDESERQRRATSSVPEEAEDGEGEERQREASAVTVAAAAAAAVAGAPTDFLPFPTNAPATGPGSAAAQHDTTATAAATVAALQRLQHEQARDAARLLRATVAELDELSTTASQRLDAAYGSALARIGALQGTVLALQTLAVAAAVTNRHFAADAAAVTREVEQQIAQLEGGDANASTSTSPAAQQRRLQQLASRVHDGREAVQALSARLDAVRRRVERWERADRAWQERTRRRLKVLWVVMSSVVLVLVVLLVMTVRSRGQAAVGSGAGGGAGGDDAYVDGDYGAAAAPPLGPSGRIPPDVAIPGLTAPVEEKTPFHLLFHSNGTADSPGAAVEEDLPLRLLDEL